jgi:SLT domain-containing protein
MAQTAQKNAEQLAKVFGENSEEAKAALEQAQKHLEMATDIQHIANTYVQWMSTYAPDAFQSISAIDKYKAGLINNLPAYANGGIVTQPTIALVGEAGPEIIIPFNRLNEVMQNLFDNIAKSINKNKFTFSNTLQSLSTDIAVNFNASTASVPIAQNTTNNTTHHYHYNIDKLEFPNVTNGQEVVDTLKKLPRLAMMYNNQII